MSSLLQKLQQLE
jgi:hypothetical protein